MEYEDSEESVIFSDFEELDQAREIHMTFERDGHVFFEQVEAVMHYFDLKLTQKVCRLDLVRRLQSKAQLKFCIKSAIKYQKAR